MNHCSPRYGPPRPRPRPSAPLGALAAPAATHAATLGPATIDGVDYVRYVAAPGETNRLVVRPAPPAPSPSSTPARRSARSTPTCVTVTAHEARCDAALVPALNVALGDGDDSATVDVNKPGVLSGDAGNDHSPAATAPSRCSAATATTCSTAAAAPTC